MPLEKCANKPTKAETTERIRIRTRKPRHYFICLILGLPSFPCITNISSYCVIFHGHTVSFFFSWHLVVSFGLWTLLDSSFSVGPGNVVRFCIIATDTRDQHSLLGGLFFIGRAFWGTSGIPMYCLARTEFKMATAAFQKLRCGAGSIVRTYSCSVS